MSSWMERIESRMEIRRATLAADTPKALSGSSRYPSLPQLSFLTPGSSNTLPRYFGKRDSHGSSFSSMFDEDSPPENVRPAHSSLPHEGFSARNQEWAR